MRRESGKKKLNNRGFSLVELLIAIVILSIVVFPLLHSFVTATKTNTKSRKKLEATSAAQNVMEEIKGTKLAQLFETEDLEYSEADGTYMIPFTQEINGNAYNVQAILDASDYKKVEGDAADTTKRLYNDAQLPNISDMDVRKDGFYVQSAEQDRDAAEELAKNTLGRDAVTTAEANQYYNTMQRTISIVIESVSSANDNLTIANVTYRYHNPSGSEGHDVISTSRIYDNADVNNGALRALYLFYNPLYTSNNSGSLKDQIKITNQDGTDVTLYLVKQSTNTSTSALEDTYRVGVDVIEAPKATNVGWLADTSYRAKTKIRTNIGWSVLKDGNDAYPVEEHQVTVSFSNAGKPAPDGERAKQVLDWTSLTKEEVKDRIYTVTIKVFKADIDQKKYDEDNLVLTYTGTKEE